MYQRCPFFVEKLEVFASRESTLLSVLHESSDLKAGAHGALESSVTRRTRDMRNYVCLFQTRTTSSRAMVYKGAEGVKKDYAHTIINKRRNT